ncbi:MAG TPA: ERCC4 domain-containing protein [Gemmatimonadales bacterium]|nr:ERCC4 domain-containing protein [Gemmatimonadales bacterium]
MTATWILERTASPRFPFRLSIEQNGRLIFAVRAQATWPGPGQQIFCLRERELDPAEPLEPLERVPVAHLTRLGRKLTLVLDRASRKRCELLVVQRPRRDGTGTDEQVFFRTESGIRAHRSRTHLELAPPGSALAVVVDTAERYPWRFPGAVVERRKLAVGDYALLDGERVAAVVERKSFENLLAEVGAIQALHQQLADLASHEAAALVIEADYRDFLDPARLAGRWKPAHLARVLAELAALHPTLPIVYAGNRRLANLWTGRFFAAVAARRADAGSELVRELELRYEPAPRAAGLDEQIRIAVLEELPAGFAFAELAARFGDTPRARLRRVLQQLLREGRVVRTGQGRASRWERLPPG